MQALDKEVKALFGKVVFGAVGAVSSQTSYGFTVTRTGTGAYTITLADKYKELLAPRFTIGHATEVDTQVQLVTDLSAAGTVITVLHKSGGAAADPASGSFLFIALMLKNTNQTP